MRGEEAVRLVAALLGALGLGGLVVIAIVASPVVALLAALSAACVGLATSELT